jgi:hypothetical protein
MAYPTAHLLGLPRELRDRIYSFLTQQIDFNWDRDKVFAPRGLEGDIQLVEPVPLRLINSPIAHVFRIHPQIHAEYEEATLTSLEAIIDPALHTTEASHFRPRPDWITHVNTALAHVRHFTVFLKIHARSTSQSLDWEDQLGLLDDVAAKASGLSSLRVAVHQQYHLNAPTISDEELDSILIPATTRLNCPREFLPRMPLALANMSLVQRGEGYHVGQGGLYNDATQSRLVSSVSPGQINILRHGIRKNGAYTYVRSPGECTKRLWTVEELVAKWPMRKYNRCVKFIVDEARAKWLEGLPYRMTEWLEMRGIDKVKSWN